jgi:hypothetical protein
MVRFHPRSLTLARSVSVEAARVCGMDEDRVQIPDGPLAKEMEGQSDGRRKPVASRSSIFNGALRVQLPLLPLCSRLDGETDIISGF